MRRHPRSSERNGGAPARRQAGAGGRDPLAQVRRLAINESKYAALDAEQDRAEFVCECARAGCDDATVELTVAEYEAVRRHAGRFVVAPSRKYVFAPLETIVEDNDRYFVVERTSPEASG
jgi:hypothetical protein